MIDRIARHYPGRWLQGYARGKLRADPAFSAAFEALHPSALPVLDIGCGIGLLEFYLRERGFQPPLHGFDFDARKIAHATRIAAQHFPDVSFSLRDAAHLEPFAGSVVIFDVLHYLTASAQQELLESAAASIAPGGVCLIRETLRDGSWRFRATQLEEWILRATLWMKSGARHYPTAEEIVSPFRARGFMCEVRPLWGRTPFNSHLFILRRPLPSSALPRDL